MKEENIIFDKISYREKFLHSGFCIINSKPFNKEKFERRLKTIRVGNYKVYDCDTEKIYNPSDKTVKNLKNFIIVRKSHLPKTNLNNIINIKNQFFIFILFRIDKSLFRVSFFITPLSM